MKLALTIVLGLALAGSAAGASNRSTLTIRHEVHGCHSWSFDGTSWRAAQSAVMAPGSVITVVDDDLMPHTLLQTRGPKALITGAAMKHMGAKAHVVFSAKGTYVFTTKPGEDYTKGVVTTGEDNVLRLVVKVT